MTANPPARMGQDPVYRQQQKMPLPERISEKNFSR